MENSIILHSTPLKDFRDIIGNIVEEKLKQFKPETLQTNANSEYLTRREVCDLLKISCNPPLLQQRRYSQRLPDRGACLIQNGGG